MEAGNGTGTACVVVVRGIVGAGVGKESRAAAMGG